MVLLWVCNTRHQKEKKIFLVEAEGWPLGWRKMLVISEV